MERAIFLGIVVLIALTTFTQGSPINGENDANVVRKDSLLEKLGMELQRDPFYSPYKKRCYCGPKRRRYRKRKGKASSGSSSSSGSDSESGSPGKYYGGYRKYGKYGYGYRPYRSRGNRSSDEE